MKEKKLKPITKKDLRMEAGMVWTMIQNYNMIVDTINKIVRITNDLEKRIEKLEG